MTSAVPDDNTKPEKGPVVISRTAEIGQASSDLWSLYLKEANERAMAKVDLWKGSLKAFLLFAGLFAAVVSPFVIDSQAKLQPTSPAAKVPISTLAINFLWFTSLTLTLISALAAVLAQTWIVKFSLVPTQGFNGAKERWIRDDQAEHWHLHAAITWITVLIQLSLFLFLAGFAVQAVADDKSLGWTILSFVGATLVLYIGITMLPWFYPTTPFGTPFSELSGRARNMFILEAPSVNAATKSKRDVRKFLQSLWENIGKTPDDDEARLGICWSILKNSSNNASINAAVLKLTRQKITRVQSRRLIELGLPDELSTRLTHLPPEKTATVVDRMRDYLHVIMWMVDECAQDVAQRFSHLVESEDALLLSLDTLPPTCRALAFAIRVNLLVGMCKVGRIHGTDWTAMIDGLDFTVALDVFRAAIRGLVTDIDSVSVKGQSSHHLRQDCARVLGAYIGSARFSNEELVKARISGDTLRMVRPQQESRGQIKKFLFQLEESWKRAMCTRTIQLMEDVRFDRHIIGCQALSSLIEQETFRDAVNDVFPDLGSTLKAVDWKNFRDALSRLSEILPQDSLGAFPEAVTANFLQLINLMSDQRGEVRTGVLHDQIESDLQSNSWRIRVARLQSLAALIKTNTMSTAILAQAPSIMACLSFNDEDVRLAAIRALQELAQHDGFQDVMDNNISDILKLVSDGDSSVRAAAIEFVAELAGQPTFHPAINRNITGFISDTLSSEDWFVRRDGLQAFGKIINSGQTYDGGIQTAFHDILKSLSDTNEDVREKALEVVSIAAGKAALNTRSDAGKTQQVPVKEIVSGAILFVLDAMNNSSRTQIAALGTLSALAKIGDLTEAIPKIVHLFQAEQEDVRVSALETCSEIAKVQPAALHTAFDDTVAKILSAVDSTSGWETQIAALKCLSTLAGIDDLCKTLDHTALDKILVRLTDRDGDVRAQAVDTLTVFASKARFHTKLKLMVRNILPLLEDWSGIVRRKTLDMLADFAQHGILAPDKIVPLTLSESDADTTTRVDDEIVSRIISTLSEGDADTTTRVLKILSIMAKQGVTPVNPPEISLVKNSLSHRNWRVRVAGLRLLESLADDTQYKKISFPAQETIVRYLSDNVEEVQLAGLRTLFTFIDNGIFRDRVTVPNTVSDVISSLLKSDSEDVRISAIQIISTYIAKAEFDSVIDGVLPDLIKLMNPENQDSHAMILRTVCSLADTGKFFVNQVFAEGIRRILPSSLSANWNAEVRMAALQIVPVVSKHDEFDQIVAESLEALLKVTLRKDDVAGNVDEVDEAFRIEVLKTLADLAKNDTFRGRIDARLSRSYALTAKAGSWPTRVAFLKLMSVLGPSARDALKSAVKQMMPDINDTLHDNENSEVRMAGVQLLSISVVKEISSSEFNTLVPTLVTLLSDSEEEVRITALQTLSDLAKQDVFRKVINETLPALFESVKRNEPKTRIGALDTCVSLAQDVAFCDIVSHAAPQIIAWVRDDPDYDVRIAAMGTLSHLSRNEAFRLIVPEAAPHVISHLENGAWSIRLQVLRTLSTFAENDAFRDIMKNSFPRIVQCMRDEDDDVRVEVLTMLLNLLQQNLYQTSIRNALQSSGLKPLIDSMSDHLTRVRLAALPLIPKVIELDAFRDPSSARLVISTIGNLLSDHDDELCLVALEALRALVEQDVAYAQQLTPLIPRLLQFLKPDHSNSGIPTTVLLTLSTTVALDEGSVDKVVEGIRTLFSDFKDSPESQFWDAATRVFSALASRGVQETVSSYVTSALGHSNWRTQISGMSVLELIEQENFGFQFDGFRPLVIKLVESSDLDVSLAAIRIAGNSLNMLPDFLTYHKVDAAIQKTMREVLGNIKSTDPSKALEQLTQFVHDSPLLPIFVEERLIELLPVIGSALKDQRQGIACLRAISKLAVGYRFRDALVQLVPRITGLLSNKKTPTENRLEVLENLLKLAEYPNFRTRIQGQAAAIIAVLKDRDSKIHVAGLEILLKLVQEVPPEMFSDRIKSTLPTLLRLTQTLATREASIALISCLAADKTFRAGVLEKLLPMTLSGPESLPSWGHLRLIARLFEDERLQLEAADLRFLLCFMTSKNLQVQDFVLKFMILTLQQYLATWINSTTFPPSLLSAFSSLAMLKR